MTTTLSSKGQVVLPSPLRRKLGLHAGDPLEAKIEGGRIILTPAKPRTHKAVFKKSPITGLTVLSTGGPTITSEMVYAALEDFP